MPGLAGVIYPQTFPLNQIIYTMLGMFPKHDKNVEELFFYKNIALGAISDSSHFYQSKNIWLAFDGCIYNEDELRDLLSKAGRRVDSDSPAELLAKYYEYIGDTFAKDLNGSFSLVIFDKKRQSLLIYRDHMGIKPLYWIHYKGYIIFASEVKAILSLDFIPQIPSLEGIGAYLYFGFYPQDLSPIFGINKLMASHYLKANLNQQILVKQYWFFNDFFCSKKSLSEAEISSEVDHLLTKATKLQLKKSPSNINCLLAGSIGSIGTAYFLKKAFPAENIQTLTASFKEQTQEETKRAHEASQVLKLSLISSLKSIDELIDQLPRIMWHTDEPVSNQNILLIWALAQQAKDYSSTFFTGTGCNELLAGNLRYSNQLYYAPIFQWLFHLLNPAIKKTLIPILHKSYKRATFKMLRISNFDPWFLEFLKHNALFSFKKLKKLSPNATKYFDPKFLLQRFQPYLKEETDTGSFLYFDAQTILTDNFIFMNEKVFSTLGLQWHSPFLDRNFIEYILQVPENMKIRNQKTAIPLKGLLESSFSKEFLAKNKSLSPYLLNQLMKSEKLNHIFGLLPRGVLCESGIISKKELLRTIRATNHRRYRFSKLWALLCLEVWFRHYVNRPTIGQPNLDLPLVDFLSTNF